MLALILAATLNEQAITLSQRVDIREPKVQGLSAVEFALPIACQLADAASTLDALSRPGTPEGNPAMAKLAAKPALFVALKASAGLTLSLLTNKLAKSNRKTDLVLLGHTRKESSEISGL